MAERIIITMEKEKTKLKTWKDLLDEGVINQEQYGRGQVEAVKWVKEDINYCGRINNGEANVLIKRWMKRLNITEKDLKLSHGGNKEDLK